MISVPHILYTWLRNCAMSTRPTPKSTQTFRSHYRKKRPKTFMIRKTTVPSPLTSTPEALASASGTKLASSLQTTPTSCNSPMLDSPGESLPFEGKLKGYRLLNAETLAGALQKVGKCGSCDFPLVLKESISVRRGLVSRLSIECENPACHMLSYISDPYNKDTGAMSVLGMRVGRA